MIRRFIDNPQFLLRLKSQVSLRIIYEWCLSEKENLEMLMQDLTIYLKSGEKLSLVFEAEKADELHPQIEAFFKALNYIIQP